ncbi:MAG: lipocalin-like domain-containing protein [Oceanicaulis sp.]
MIRILTAFLAALPVLAGAPAFAQGFAGLGTEAEGFAVPRRGHEFQFPQDHLAHPEYRIEWWYLTANLTGEDGREYGVQWTLFRSALAPEAGEGFAAPQLYMGHAGLTTPDAHYHAERLARGGVGQAGTDSDPFTAYIDEWEMRSMAQTGDALDALALFARGEEFSYRLDLSAQGPLVFHGEAGYSVKSAAGQASYYYSQPFYAVEGVLDLPEGETAVTGTAWLDREWSSQPLSEDQNGWDWVSLNFDSGAKLMGFQLRQTDGSVYTSASWIEPDGALTAFPDGALAMTPLETSAVAGRDVPTRWRVVLPARGLDVEIDAVFDQAWMATRFAYWEGPVRITGSHSGRGYLEMTGYEPVGGP